jgi:UPF0755 protein
MFKKILVLAFLIVFVGGLTGTYLLYRGYQNRRAERIARLQQAAAETTVTVIEGWDNKQIGDYYEKQNLFSKSDFLAALNKFDESKFPLLKRPTGMGLEGYMFPDTYRIPKEAKPDDVINKMLVNFSSRLSSLGISDPDAKYNGLSLYQILTLASIIEKESGGKGTPGGTLSLQQERDLVASVFYNRLGINQALESDATVNYATGKDTPSASAEDLTIDSPYNTYKYPGLPPGPICNPSLGSIKAALNPAKSDYFYFLHLQPSGQVEFSKTFAEHVKKKQQ